MLCNFRLNSQNTLLHSCMGLGLDYVIMSIVRASANNKPAYGSRGQVVVM